MFGILCLLSMAIPLSEPVIRGNEWKYVKDCLDTGWVSSVGSYVNKFEEMMAAYTGTKYAVATTNGTAALHLSLLVSGVKAGDEVLVPTLTFIATANAVRYCGAEPVFFDSNPKTFCLDVRLVHNFLTQECERRTDGFTYNKKTGRRVSVVLPVHIFGHPVDMDPLLALAREYNLRVIEDATESLGSLYKGRKTGSFGDLGCFSFNGNKIITTGGGGMVVTNDETLASRIRHLSTQAKKDPFTSDHDEVGYNYRLTNVLAAIGVAQMEKLDEYVAIKRKNLEQYRALLNDLSAVQLAQEASWAKSNFWFYTLTVPQEHRGPLIKYLTGEQIQVRPIWKLMHTLPMYASSQVYGTGAPVAVRIWQTGFNLPCSVNLSEEDIHQVADLIINYFKTYGNM